MKASDRKRMREMTMACWWPCRAFPMPEPDWGNIASELLCLAESARVCRNDLVEANEAVDLALIAMEQLGVQV